MRIHADTFVALVLGRLGESPSPVSAFAAEAEGLSLCMLIRELAPQGAAQAILDSPYADLDDFSHFGESVGRRPDGMGYVMLPDDFLRLVSFRSSGWESALTEAALPDSPRFRLMSSPCPSLRGSRRRPSCRLIRRGVGRVLEFYPCSPDSHVSEALYIARPFFDTEGYMRLPGACLAAAVENTAKLKLESEN